MRLAVLLAVLLTGCGASRMSTVDYVTGRSTLNRFDLNEEVALGEQQATLFIAASEALNQPINPDDIYTRTVRTVARRILAVPENRARMPPVPWEVHLVGGESRNAFAVAGGVVFVLGGMLKWGWIRNEHELAAILGHEMGHVAARHLTERQTAREMRAQLAPFGKFFSRRLVELINPDDPEAVIDFIKQDGQQFDHSQELEADVIGMELMARAGYAPKSAVGIWRRLAASNQHPEAGATPSHPAYRARIRELERHLDAARLVARRSRPPTDTSSTGWSWGETDTDHSFPRAVLPESGPLIDGAHVPSVYLRQAVDVLDVRVRAFVGPGGEAARTAVSVEASVDLVADQVPFSCAMYVEPYDKPNARTIFAARLAHQVQLRARVTEMRALLPRLEPGRYRIRVRALVGSLWTERSTALEVPKPEREFAL